MIDALRVAPKTSTYPIAPHHEALRARTSIEAAPKAAAPATKKVVSTPTDGMSSAGGASSQSTPNQSSPDSSRFLTIAYRSRIIEPAMGAGAQSGASFAAPIYAFEPYTLATTPSPSSMQALFYMRQGSGMALIGVSIDVSA